MSEICKACVESGVSKICGTSGGYVCEHYPERKQMAETIKIEKAIQVIKDLNFKLAKDGVTKQANDMAIQALEKQMPKAITHEATVRADGTCPNCKNVVKERNQDFNYEYCHFCGQRLE